MSPEGGHFSGFGRWMPWLLPVALGLLGLLSFEALHGLAKELSYESVVHAVRDTATHDLLFAILATAISYLALTGYDRSALRYVGAQVSYRTVCQTAFIAYALSNSVGLGVLTGGAVRLRMYGAAGVSPERVARAIAFSALAFGFGIGVVGAVALLWAADDIASIVHVPTLLLRLAAGLVLMAAAALLLFARSGGERHLPGGLRITLPPLPLSLQQLVFSIVDIAASAMVLWLLLPSGSVDPLPFLGFYAIATMLGIVSHLPGGIGVFEAVILLALGGHVPPDRLAGALVLYRIIYYVMPLVVALTWLVLHEVWRSRQSAVVRSMVSLTPSLMAAMTLVVGTILLLSGATPATDEATALLARHVPLPLVEAAHLLGSVAGLMLLFVARGMLLRLDAAWWMGLILGLFGIALAVPKGIAVNEALLLTTFVALLALSHRQFTRKASLFSQPFSPAWTAAVTTVLLAVTMLLFVVYHNVQYANQLWWKFEFDAHAPRSLRALLAVILLTLVLSLRQLFRPAAPALPPVDPASLESAATVIRAQETADANLALMGDKQLLFSDSGKAFVMYGRRGRSWVALFDPVGPAAEAPDLIWRFLERARDAGGRASFYQVRPENLPHYLDAGLRLFKLGEHAVVSLPEFSLKGPKRAGLRQSLNRAEREGLSFEVLPADATAGHLPVLKQISDAWLDEHRVAEKRFSLGAFDEAYVQRQPVALVRNTVGQVVAFVTVMSTDLQVEASVDLMRHLPGAPRGAMDFLFVKLMLHYQAQGYRRFGLGMAPLSGMAEHPLAPNWHRLGRLLFTHGEHFYNFQGLRAFKEKFDPQWQPRYLAAPGGVAPLLVLADTAALISGGLQAAFSK